MAHASFDPETLEQTFSSVVKNLERRWGLSIVSFLPPNAQRSLENTQRKMSGLCGVDFSEDLDAGRTYIEFQSMQQLHCTHISLRRSDPRGPVSFKELTRPGGDLKQLLEVVQCATGKIDPFEVAFDRIKIGHDGLGIIALGECCDAHSIRSREILLKELNEELRDRFNLSTRSWDNDSKRFHKVHCALGFMKRAPSRGFKEFRRDVTTVPVSVSCTLKDITLVHHRYRTLLSPQEGSVTFALDEIFEMSPSDFIEQLNLAN